VETMEYMVSIDLEAREPVDQDTLDRVAALGGPAAGRPGERRVGATMTVVADNTTEAAAVGADRLHELLVGEVVAVEVLAADEADRRLARPAEVGIS